MGWVDIERLAGRRRGDLNIANKVTVSVYWAFAAAGNTQLYLLERARSLFKCEVLNVCQLLFK